MKWIAHNLFEGERAAAADGMAWVTPTFQPFAIGKAMYGTLLNPF